MSSAFSDFSFLDSFIAHEPSAHDRLIELIDNHPNMIMVSVVSHSYKVATPIPGVYGFLILDIKSFDFVERGRYTDSLWPTK